MKTINDYAELVKEEHALNKTLAPVEDDLTGASQPYAKGAKFINSGILFQAKTDIAQGAALVLNTNYEAAPDVETQIANEAAARSQMGAKNLVPYPYYNGDSRDTNGILFTVNTDGSITISGEATADAYFRLTYNTGDVHIPLEAGKSYILSASGKADVAMLLRDDSSSNVAVARGADATYNCATSGNFDAIILVENGAVYTTPITVYPMLRLATDANGDYQPYAKTNKELTDDVSSLNSAIAKQVNEIADMNNVLGAKNLLSNTALTVTRNDLTFTVNSDGSVTVNGTATAETFLSLNSYAKLKLLGNYILNGCPANGSNTTYQLYAQERNASDTGFEVPFKDFGNGVNVQLTTGNGVEIVILIRSGQTINNLTFKPMLRLASIQDDTYEPHSMTNREMTPYVQAISNPNLLDNPWFTVNQRRKSQYTAAGKSVDRWAIMTDFVLDVTSNGVTITNNSESVNNNFHTLFDIDRFLPLFGKTVTLSIMLSDGTIKSKSVLLPDVSTITSSWQNITVTFDTINYGGIFYKNDVFQVYVGVKAGQTVNLRAVKLEVGKVSTLAMDTAPNYAEELLKCQRYFQVIPQHMRWRAVNVTQNSMMAQIPLVTAMRTQPTLLNTMVALRSLDQVTAFTATEQSVPLNGFNYSGILLTATYNSHGLTDGQLDLMNGDLWLSAEL